MNLKCKKTKRASMNKIDATHLYFTNSYADWDKYMKLPDNVRIIKVV